jgi:molybdopterin converting factor small subunit
MPIKVHIPTPLRPFTDKLDVVELDGATIGELMSNLTTQFGGLKQHLFNEEGRLRSFVNVYVNDEDIRFLGGDTYQFQDRDEVMFIPSIAGGCK